MDHFELSHQVEADFQNLPYHKVMELRQKMAHQVADIDLNEPIEDIKKWYRRSLLKGMESDGYLSDDLRDLIYLYISAVAEDMEQDWRNKEHFWQHLNGSYNRPQ